MRNKNNNASKMVTSNELMNLLKIIALVVVIFLVFYLITVLVKNKKDDKEEETETTIQYSKILAGSILNQKDSEYYVLVKFKDDSYLELYEEYLMSATSDKLKYYTVDMSEKINESYIAEKSKLDTNKMQDIKFSKTTLLEVKDKKIEDAKESKDDIISKLKEITK